MVPYSQSLKDLVNTRDDIDNHAQFHIGTQAHSYGPSHRNHSDRRIVHSNIKHQTTIDENVQSYNSNNDNEKIQNTRKNRHGMGISF